MHCVIFISAYCQFHDSKTVLKKKIVRSKGRKPNEYEVYSSWSEAEVRGSTSTMSKHLWARHSISDPRDRERKPTVAGLLEEDVKPMLARTKSAPASCPSVASFFSAAKPAEEVTKLIVEMIFVDLVPVSTVEHKGFRNLIHFLTPGYTVPARKTIVARLKARYEEVKERAANLLKSGDVQSLSLTTDLWTSIANDG